MTTALTRSAYWFAVAAVAVLAAFAATLPGEVSAGQAPLIDVPGSLRDYNGIPVPDTGFTVYNGTAYESHTSDANGEFTVSLEEGAVVSFSVPGFANVGYVTGSMDPFTVTADSTAHYIQGFTVSTPATIIGTPGNDVLLGTSGDDVILGLGGDDIIVGRLGDDVLVGGLGDDHLKGSVGEDTINGGSGDDSVDAGAGADYVRTWDGDDYVLGAAGPDVIYTDEGSDSVDGGSGADEIIDNAGNGDVPGTYNIIDGGNGQDSILLSAAPGTIRSGAGNDNISVSGAPTNPSEPYVYCGDGTDEVIYNSHAFNHDAITDSCEIGGDVA